MLRKFYSELNYGKGYVLVYLMENYRNDMQQIIELRESIREDFPDVKDNQILVKRVGDKESNCCVGCLSLRFKVKKVKNLDEFSLFFTQLSSQMDYAIVDESATVKKYWSKVEGILGFVVRYAMKEGYRSDMEYLMSLMEVIKADYPDVSLKVVNFREIEYWYSEVLAGVTALEFTVSSINCLEIEKFPINEEPDC